ncbi:MAG: Nif3-like dinuclear metal center hexameric protein, partial [Paramuribaculum sp.]|nr:Nif3-like dinuclear metal center hexameric protein [Paramuribaculum sp.]
MTPTIQEILRPLEQFAPLSLQEDYDNCGLLIGSPDTPCTGALLTVDVTPATVAEAIATGCN